MEWLMIRILLLIFMIEGCLPQEGVRDDSNVQNVVRQAVADEFDSEILTNRTKAHLSCESGEMVVTIDFDEPFRGVTYTDYDRSSPCRFYGDGAQRYVLRIPLKGCGTRQEAPRLFINNIIVRFHRSLELEEDEIKTIICRYPPPLAPPPAPIVAPAIAPAPAAVPPRLSEIELLLIISAILFLTLLLLGIGIAYYCLKKRNIHVVKKKKAISAPPSEITKISGSTIFEPVKIPRASAVSTGEAAVLIPQESIASDYPSESPSPVSELEEAEGRRTTVVSDSFLKADHMRFENVAFVPDGYPEDQERAESISAVEVKTVPPPPHRPKRSVATEEEIFRSTEETEDILSSRQVDRKFLPREEIEEGPRREAATYTDIFRSGEEEREVSEDISKQIVVKPPKPKLMVQNIDDVFVTTTTEVTNTEHITKETKAAPGKTPDWDVTIRHYPSDRPAGFKKPQPKFDVLLRVLNPPPLEGAEELSLEDKEKWRSVLSSDSSFRSQIQQATTREKIVETIRSYNYESLFEEHKWEIIIRILESRSSEELLSDIDSSSPGYSLQHARFRKRETRSRRSGTVRSKPGAPVEEVDLRSITETDVEFGHPESLISAEEDAYYSGYQSEPEDSGMSAYDRSRYYLARSKTDSSPFPTLDASLQRWSKSDLDIPRSSQLVRKYGQQFHTSGYSHASAFAEYRQTGGTQRQSYHTLESRPAGYHNRAFYMRSEEVRLGSPIRQHQQYDMDQSLEDHLENRRYLSWRR